MFFLKSPIGQDKSNEFFLIGQENEPIFRSLANVKAVKTELKNELRVINKIILNARKEVDSQRDKNPYLFMESRTYSQIFNSLIKGKIREEILFNPSFGVNVKVKSRYGSAYFIVKDKYLIYIKKLNGSGRPNYVSTPRSNNLMNQLPFEGGLTPIPILFVGPQFKGLVFEGTSVTSLISKKEVNWNLSFGDLFSDINYNSVEVVMENKLDNVRLKSENSTRKKASS